MSNKHFDPIDLRCRIVEAKIKEQKHTTHGWRQQPGIEHMDDIELLAYIQTQAGELAADILASDPEGITEALIRLAGTIEAWLEQYHAFD